MKGAVVTQWVRAESAQVPPDQSLASTSVVNSTCKPSNGSTRLEGSRIQAASLSPEINVVDKRISLSIEGKADGLPGLEGNSPGYALASRGDSTGVCERGMYPQG